MCWRRYPYAGEEGECSPIAYGSPATYPLIPDEEVELVSADPEKDHEERRILERFASFPSANKSRPVSILLGASGGGGGGGTPKSGRRRNKRKGCDSPRLSAEEKEMTKIESSPQDVLAIESIESVAENCNNGKLHYISILCLVFVTPSSAYFELT